MSEFSIFHWLVVLGIGYFLFRIFNKPAKKDQGSTPAAIPMFVWPKKGDYECDIVGEGFCQLALKKLAGQHGKDSAAVHTTAVLVPYSTNPHDNQAVRVDIDGNTVGHLGREDARTFRRRLSAKNLGTAPTSCSAMVMGGFTNRQGEVASYGVRLDIQPFD